MATLWQSMLMSISHFPVNASSYTLRGTQIWHYKHFWFCNEWRFWRKLGQTYPGTIGYPENNTDSARKTVTISLRLVLVKIMQVVPCFNKFEPIVYLNNLFQETHAVDICYNRLGEAILTNIHNMHFLEYYSILEYLPYLELRNRSIQIVVITNFVAILNIAIKRFDCIKLSFWNLTASEIALFGYLYFTI